MIVFGFGISRGTDLTSDVISEATRACVQGPYVLGNPATHAYVWWTHRDGFYYRVDGMPPRSEISLWDGPDGNNNRSAHWELTDLLYARGAHKRALSLVGMPYSIAECAAQPIIAKLPHGIKEVAENAVEIATPGAQCTVLAVEVLRAAGGRAKHVADSMSGKFPEQLGQAFAGAEGECWIRRV